MFVRAFADSNWHLFWRPEMSRPKTVKPSFEILEDRLAPAVHLVTRISDQGPVGFAGELRTEINGAASGDIILIELQGWGSTIQFDQALNGPIGIPQNLTIIGM